MAKLEWDGKTGNHKSGVDRGVLYLGGVAHPWNGLVSVEELDATAIDTSLFYDGQRHRFAQDTGYYTANVSAFTYPAAFDEYDGLDGAASGQPRKRFNFSYRVGGDVDYDIHLVYNALVFPMPRGRSTTTDSGSTSPFTWTLVSSGTDLTWTKSGAHLIVNKQDAHPTPFGQLESYIYGTPNSLPFLPSPDSVINMFESYTELRVDYNGDGTYTAEGPGYLIDEPEPVVVPEGEPPANNGIIKISNPTAFDVFADGTFIMRSHWEEA